MDSISRIHLVTISQYLTDNKDKGTPIDVNLRDRVKVLTALIMELF